MEALRVARIGKPHGIRGEVTVQLYTDEPEVRLSPGAVVVREPGTETQDQATTPLTITSQRWNKKICLLGFEEIPDRNAAEALRGTTLYVETPETAEGEDEWYSHELEGLNCVDETGEQLGVVVELVTGPAQDLLVVRTPAGEEVMVPFVEELVPGIDPEAGQITLRPPEGLFP